MILNKLKLIAIWAGITAILCTVSLIYGYFWGKENKATEELDAVNNTTKIEHEIKRLPVGEANKRLRDEWCRDCK